MSWPSLLRGLAVLVLATVAGPAAAQLPSVGGVINNTAGQIGQTVGNIQNTAQGAGNDVTQSLRHERLDRLNALRRAHPDVIDTDRNGAPVIRGEVLVMAPSATALNAARARGFTLARRVDASGGLDLNVIVLRAPAGMTTRQALALLQRLDPRGAYDFDHLYSDAGEENSVATHNVRQSSGDAGNRVRIGLVDGGVDASHPAFRSAAVYQRGFASTQPLANLHGTEVASLMVGADGDFHGAASGASLYVADVYGDAPTGGGAAAIVAALDWLAEQRTPVMNVSLVGPPNRVLEAAVRALIARGFIIVAAVGNDGPNAPPLYPASYPGVIGVTGVDARDRALPEAARGPQVDFAAPGSDMRAAAMGGGYANVRGTSFAAPIVAGLLAQRLSAPSIDGAARAQSALGSSARDLGARGRDSTFGEGLVGAELRNRPTRVARH